MFLTYALLLSFWISNWQEGQLTIIPTVEEGVFKVIYQADMRWNVDVKILNNKGQRRFKMEVKNTDSFILPVNMLEEPSGTYMVELSTAAYDLTKEFEFVHYHDRAAQYFQLEYVQERHQLRIVTTEPIEREFYINIFDDSSKKLIGDLIPVSQHVTMRNYNLDGAETRAIQLAITLDGNRIIREFYDF